MPHDLIERIQRAATDSEFSGVVELRIRETSYREAFGHRDRANAAPNDLDTRFGIASGTKGFTALAVAKLIEDGALGFDTPATEIIGSRVKGLAPDVTIRHLLGHTSGVGDHLDEELVGDIDAFILPIPVQELQSPLDYIPLLERAPRKFKAGERFSYSNGGYVLLAIVVELLSPSGFLRFVEDDVFAPAGMARSGFFRSDRLPGDTALGYIPTPGGWKTNVFHLPIVGSGDGGAYATVDDMAAFWRALKGGAIVSQELVAELARPRALGEGETFWYGYGFWLDRERDRILLQGYDAGVSFESATARDADEGYTVIGNTTSGAWPIARLLRAT